MINFTLLGPVTAWHGTWTAKLSRQQQLLLAILVMERGPVSQDGLVRALWDGDIPPDGGLKRVVAELRAQLRTAPPEAMPAADLLPARDGTYGLSPAEKQQADVLRFRAKLAEAELIAGRDAIRPLRESMREWGENAAGLFGGQPLTGLPGTWADSQRAALRSEYRDCLIRCLLQDIADQPYARVAAQCRRLDTEPAALHDEQFVGLWMIATYRAGQRIEAIRIFDRAAASVQAHLRLKLRDGRGKLAEIIRADDHDRPDADLLSLVGLTAPERGEGRAASRATARADRKDRADQDPAGLAGAIDALFADWEHAMQQAERPAGAQLAFADEQQLKTGQAAGLVARGQLIPALRLYQQVLGADPDSPRVLLDVASIISSGEAGAQSEESEEAKEDRLGKAVALLDHAVARCSDRWVTTRIIGLRGYCRYLLRDFAAAVRDLESVLAMPGTRQHMLDRPSMWFLSACYLELGQREKATQTLRGLQRLAPGIVEVPLMLARIAAATGDVAGWDSYAASTDQALRRGRKPQGGWELRGGQEDARFAASISLYQSAATAGWPDRAGRRLREAAEVALRTGRDDHTAQMQEQLELVASLLRQAPDKKLLAWLLDVAVADTAGDLVLDALARHGVISEPELAGREEGRRGG